MADATVGVVRGFIVMVVIFFYEEGFRTSPLHTKELLRENLPTATSACTSLILPLGQVFTAVIGPLIDHDPASCSVGSGGSSCCRQ